MRSPFSGSGSHPAPEVLALHSRSDLRLTQRLRTQHHLARCPDCERQVLLFRSASADLKREAATETLTAYEAITDWTGLEREMLGNIVVGVAAARCIEKVSRKRKWIPRIAMATGLSALFVAGWFTHIPRAQNQHLAASLTRLLEGGRAPLPANYVGSTPTGIAVRSQGVTLTILHPPSAIVSLSGSSSVEARYVDEDTGQLTITNVYGQ